MNGQTSSVETPNAKAVSSEISNILNELDKSEFVHAQGNLSRRLDKIHSELGKIEMRAWLGSEPKLHIEKMLGEIISERLDSHLRSIHDALHEVCVTILDNSREIRKMNAHLSDSSHGPCNAGSGQRDVSGKKKDGILAPLSTREREVVDHLLSGMTNREIADRLEISERTVKNHLWKIYKKMGVETRTQLFCILASP
jgi:DNA-binding CsgD family transcriptional regulator